MLGPYVADTPGDSTLLTGGRRLVGLARDACKVNDKQFSMLVDICSMALTIVLPCSPYTEWTIVLTEIHDVVAANGTVVDNNVYATKGGRNNRRVSLNFS